MTPGEQYVESITALDEEYQAEKKRILYEYARAVCPCKKGDKVHDETGWIRVDKILITYRNDDLPEIHVSGVMLTRHKEVRIDGKTRAINIEDILK